MEFNAASDVQGDGRWRDLDEISQHIQILPQETLKQIAKDSLVKFTHECNDDQKVRRLWQSLLKTFSTASISPTHTAAACNAVRAFLDAALVSKNLRTREIALSSETCLAVFETYVSRFEDAKPKPMRHVLTSLVNILVKHPQQDELRRIKSRIGNAIFPDILLREKRSRIKAALVSLESFIRKSAITPSDLISLVSDWLAKNHQKFTALCEEDRQALSIPTPQYATRDPNGGVFVNSSKETAAQVLVLGLLKQAQNKELASSAGAVLATFLQKMRAAMKAQQLPANDLPSGSTIWVVPVKHMALQNLDNLESISNDIFHPIFEVDPSGFYGFIDHLPLKSLLAGDMTDAPLSEYMILFAALQVGKKVGLVHEDHNLSNATAAKANAGEALVLNSEIIGQFLLHRESSIRIATLALLITAFSTTKPLTSAAMRAILKGLPSMHADSDPYSRGEILSLTRKLIVRLKGGVLKDAKDATANPTKPTLERSNSETQAYLTAYIEFLKADMQPTASYPRHITALKALTMFLESGLDSRIEIPHVNKGDGSQSKWKFNMDICQPSLLRLLVDLLLDPFEEVRATSLYIINLFPRDLVLHGMSQVADQCPVTKQRLTDALSRAEKLASQTSRADHADTVARIYHILFCAAASGIPKEANQEWWETKAGIVDAILRKLEEKLSLPGGLFNSAMRNAPLHGYLSALRYIILMPNFYTLISDESSDTHGAWKSVHTRIAAVCDQIWLEVKPVLCIDSPEGHSDEPMEDLDVGPKDILSYSWRALRESSLLLHSTLANTTYGPRGEDGLQRADYEKIGLSSFTQLAELRHRGAFSTVSQTFATCCQRCSQSTDTGISSLPEAWYQAARNIIFESASKLTRRSAGIPALITGILVSQPGGPLFQHAIDDLHEISRLPAKHDKSNQEMELPQVHAMNCLKDIFTNTKLGPFTEPFIMPALHLSAERLGSPIWALRNSGLMLFRALLTRMCRVVSGGLGFGGSSGSEPGARVSFKRYPGLLELMSSLLAPESSNKNDDEGDMAMVTERVFPALELVGEKIPTTFDDDDLLLRGLVLEHIKSPVWGIREHAARVYASLLTRSDILKDLRNLLDVIRDDVTQNYLHGKALCTRYALRRFASNPNSYWIGHIEDISSTIQQMFAVFFPVAKSPFVATALVEVLNDTIERSVEAGSEGKLVALLDDLFDKHDLYDTLDYLFDSPDASWKSSSTTRASSLLRRALSWATLQKLLISGKQEDLKLFFQAVSTFDPNAARWLLEQMQETFGEKEPYRKSLIGLFSSAILGDNSELVKTAATSNLASILGVLLDFRHDNMKGTDLPWAALMNQIRTDEDGETWSREMTDAELRLQGCLLAVKAISSQWQSLPGYESELRRWATKLRFALQEETEFTTRYAAVTSLAAFGRILRPLGSPARVDPIFLDLYLILYDMLNDDDEELRDIAASTASWVLSYSSVSPSKAVALAPLNASDLLAQFVGANYPSSAVLSGKILQYVAGQEPRISDCLGSRPSTLIPVSALISKHRKESTVLFVEEKQNLFIDEVREVDMWSKTLRQLTESSYDESLLKQVSQWVADGLSYVADIVEAGESEKDGLLGWTSKPDIFSLGVRLISLAAVMVSKDFVAPRYLAAAAGQDGLRERLSLVLERGRLASLHDEWLMRIQSALEFS